MRVITTPGLGYLNTCVIEAQLVYGAELTPTVAFLTGVQLGVGLAHANPLAAEQLRTEMLALQTKVLGLAGMHASEQWFGEVVAELLAKLGEPA